jgi:hypothetical protein
MTETVEQPRKPNVRERYQEQLATQGARPRDRQVGGNHYSKMSIQPVDFIEENGLTFLEGNVIKYVVRHRDKHGKQDLEKAMHYLQMLIEREYPEDTEE